MHKSWIGKFFTIWVGQAFSLFGSSLVDFSLIWWLTELTGSEQILAFSSLMALLPRMLLGPFAGSLVDRLNRKTVMLLADGAIALVTVGLLVLWQFDLATVPVVLGVLLLRALGGMFHQPALTSATALLVPEQHLSRIAGLNRILLGTMNILSPVAGAALIALFDASSVLYIDILTAAVAIGTLLFSSVPNAAEPAEIERRSIFRETMAGLRYVRQNRALFFVVISCTAVNFCCGPVDALRPLLVTGEFGGGVFELSMVTAASGLGLLTGGVIMGLWGGFRRNLITSAVGWGGFGLGYIVIWFLPSDGMLWLYICLFVIHIFGAIGGAGLEAFYRSKVPPALHGRVFSVLATLDNTTIPLGLLVATAFGGIVPIRVWYLLMGLLHMSLFVFWMGSKRLKQAECTD